MMDEKTQIFIDLWKQGASYKLIAQTLEIPTGTVSSRAASLQAQGLIDTRPRGGSFPKTRPPDNILELPAIPTDHHESHADTIRVVSELRALYHELQVRVSRLENPFDAHQDIPPQAEKGDTYKWTIRLSGSLIGTIKRVAQQSHTQPSHLIERAMREWFQLQATGAQDDHHANQP